MQFNQIFFRPPASTYTPRDFKGFDRYFLVPTENVTNKKKLDLKIPCVIMPYMLGNEMISKYYIVYFHGNAEDLGTSYDFLYDLRQCVKCNIILTEYCGYGTYKELSPNSQQIEYDAEKIFIYLTTELQIPKQHIILLGRSMGSGPACLLASKFSTRGLMLISAFTSLKDVASNMVGFLSKLVCDRFKNIEHIEKVKCPVLLIHGKMDKLVPYQHSQKLADKIICDLMECYQEGMTHNDYDIDEDIINNIVQFLRDKMNIFQKKNDPILSKFENFHQDKFYKLYPQMNISTLQDVPPPTEFQIQNSEPNDNIKIIPQSQQVISVQSPNDLNLKKLLDQESSDEVIKMETNQSSNLLEESNIIQENNNNNNDNENDKKQLIL